MGTPPPTSELQQSQPQALHYALANAQQVQIHQIGEDGQVQVVRTFSLLCPGSEGGGWERPRLLCWPSSVCAGLRTVKRQASFGCCVLSCRQHKG